MSSPPPRPSASPMSSHMSSVEYQLGEIRAELRGISQRLDEEARRHGEHDQSDEAIRSRVTKLELIEAKRGGVMAAVAAFASVVGGVMALGIEVLVKKL